MKSLGARRVDRAGRMDFICTGLDYARAIAEKT